MQHDRRNGSRCPARHGRVGDRTRPPDHCGDRVMILRGLLICSVGIGSTSLMIGTFATAIAQRDVAGGELESCAGYSGLPSGDGVTTCDSTTSEQDLFNRSKTRKAIS